MFRSIGFIEENPTCNSYGFDFHVLIQNLLGEGLWDDQAWCTWCRPKDVCTDPSLGVSGPNNDLQTNPKTILANIFFFDETNSSRWGEIVGGLLGMGETSKQPADKSVDPFPPTLLLWPTSFSMNFDASQSFKFTTKTHLPMNPIDLPKTNNPFSAPISTNSSDSSLKWDMIKRKEDFMTQ